MRFGESRDTLDMLCLVRTRGEPSSSVRTRGRRVFAVHEYTLLPLAGVRWLLLLRYCLFARLRQEPLPSRASEAFNLSHQSDPHNISLNTTMQPSQGLLSLRLHSKMQT